MQINPSEQMSALGKLQSVASIANELAQDIEHIYHGPIREPSNLTFRKVDHGVNALIDSLHGSDLLVIATRDDKLREIFCHEVIQHVAFRRRQPITIFGMPVPFWRFTRDLVNFMADIPSDAAIYDGQLDDAEIQRLASALAQLSTAHIYMNLGRMVRIDDLCLASKQKQEKDGVGLILVNSVTQIVDDKYRVADKLQSLVRLKQLATELAVPVVAIFQLDPTVENHPATLARNELKEIEVLVRYTDRFLLLSGRPDNLVLAAPKLPIQS